MAGDWRPRWGLRAAMLRVGAARLWLRLPPFADPTRISRHETHPLRPARRRTPRPDRRHRPAARGGGLQPPAEPVLFMKAVTALSGPNDDVRIPPGGVKTDWEVELGIVIGTRARQVAEADALQHVAGYVLANDVSERAWQMERGGQWDKGKSYDTFAPIGPWLATVDEVPDPHAI